MYGCMWGSWLVRMSPIIFTGIRSPDIFFLTLRALWGHAGALAAEDTSNTNTSQSNQCPPTQYHTYLSSLMLHMMSSFQLTKIMATSFSVSNSHSSSGLWKIWKNVPTRPVSHHVWRKPATFLGASVTVVCVCVCADLCDQLQVVNVVLLCDDELVDVALPLPLHGAQHVQQMEVSTPWNTTNTSDMQTSCRPVTPEPPALN